MKSLAFFIAFSGLNYANANTNIKCTQYNLPSVCFYDEWERRGWDCQGKDFPQTEDGIPYDSIKELSLSLKGGNLSALETVYNVNNTIISEKVLFNIENVICISGLSNCETGDRKTGVYLQQLEDQDYTQYYSLEIRHGSKTKTVSTYSQCK